MFARSGGLFDNIDDMVDMGDITAFFWSEFGFDFDIMIFFKIYSNFSCFEWFRNDKTQKNFSEFVRCRAFFKKQLINIC